MPRPVPVTAGDVFHETVPLLMRRLWAYAVAALVTAIIFSTVLAPLAFGSIRWLVRRTGQYAVGNDELVGFFLSPIGVIVGVIFGVATVISTDLTRGAITLIGRGALGGERVLPASAILTVVRLLPRLVTLSLRRLGMLALVALPFLVVIGVIALIVVHGVDLNYLVQVKPPRFWIGLACALPPALVGAVLVVRLILRWTLALPIVLLEDREPAAALRESALLTRGRMALVATTRVGWFTGIAVVAAVLLGLLRWLAGAAVSPASGSLQTAAVIAGVMLLLVSATVAAMTFLGTAGDALIALILERRLRGRDATTLPAATDPSTGGRLVGVIALAAIAVAVATTSISLVRTASTPIDVEIVAHRGASASNPENSMAAFLAAVEQGADWIELDVQLSADGAVVVFHDKDFMRVAGDRRNIRDMTLAEIQSMDVGTWFDPAFSAERVPTLAEVIDAVGADARLYVELKYYDLPDDTLAARTLEVLQETGFSDRAVVISLSLEGLAQVRAQAPDQMTGYLVAASIGRVTDLDVDRLLMSTGVVNRNVVAAATANDKTVNAWTVNDPEQLPELALIGVTGIITDEVEAMRVRRSEIQQLDQVERMLLAFRVLLRG